MKFSYEENVNEAEPVAYIDRYNALIIKADFLHINNAAKLNCLGQVLGSSWNPSHPENIKKFYPGDKLTIEF